MSSPVMGSTKKPFHDGDHHNHKKKKGAGALATAYLVIYNVIMTAGYGHLWASSLKFTSWYLQHNECTGCRQRASFYTMYLTYNYWFVISTVCRVSRILPPSIMHSYSGDNRKSGLLFCSLLASSSSCACTYIWLKLLSRQNSFLFLSPLRVIF